MATKPTNSHSRRRSGTVVGLFVGLIGVGGMALATPAAAGVNCDPGFHCLFFTDVNSAKYEFFESTPNFNGLTFSGGNGVGAGAPVDNNSESASNSTAGGFESHYYNLPNYFDFLFCVNPGATIIILPPGARNMASSLLLRGRTTIHCLNN